MKKNFAFCSLLYIGLFILLLFSNYPACASYCNSESKILQDFDNSSLACYTSRSEPRHISTEEALRMLEKEKELDAWLEGKELLTWSLFFLSCITLYRLLKGINWDSRGRYGLNLESPGCFHSLTTFIIIFTLSYFGRRMIIECQSVGLCIAADAGLILFNVAFSIYKNKCREEEMKRAYDSIVMSEKMNSSAPNSRMNAPVMNNPAPARNVSVKKASTSGFDKIRDSDLLKICLAIIISDGVVDENELNSVKCLFSKAEAFNIETEIHIQLEKLKNQKDPLQYVLATITVPRDKSLLQRLISIAGADGVISEDEKKFLSKIAVKMGVNNTDLQSMIDGNVIQ